MPVKEEKNGWKETISTKRNPYKENSIEWHSDDRVMASENTYEQKQHLPCWSEEVISGILLDAESLAEQIEVF